MTAFGAPTCTAWATLNTSRDTRSTYRHRLELAAEQDIDIHEAWAAQHVTATGAERESWRNAKRHRLNHRSAVRSLVGRLTAPTESARNGAVETDEFGRSVGVSG
jgi:predicted GNAT family acetyltransferase